MANYECATRTNYFRVKDEAAFRKLMQQVIVSDNRIEVWDDKDIQGRKVFGFGCFGSIDGLPMSQSTEESNDHDMDDCSYDEFARRMSELVADDDAVIITEVGNESLRYLIGQITIVTPSGFDFLDLSSYALDKAREMLGNPTWTTRDWY